MARIVAVALAAVALAACTAGGADGGGTGRAERGHSGADVHVFAAASLSDAFTDLAAAFEAAQPDHRVVLNLAGSSALRAQILAGAPADVFASASPSIMDEVAAAGLTRGRAHHFATNRLQIATPAGNPAGITGLGDFERPELFLGLCAEPVPCGQLAGALLEGAGVEPSVDTREPDVRALLTKIAAGELDAGIVYRTDVAALGDEVTGIELAGGGPEAVYPIAALVDGPEPEGADAFVAFVLGPAGQRILAEHGFGAP